MNKKIYVVYFDTYGEFEAVFDDKFKYVGGWDCNDANWRDEYFSGFMKKLGIDSSSPLPKSVDKKKLEKEAYKAIYGSEPEE